MKQALNKIFVDYWWIPCASFMVVSILYFVDVIDYGKLDIFIVLFSLIYLTLSIIWNFTNRKLQIGIIQLIIGIPLFVGVLFTFGGKLLKGYY